MNEDAAPAPLHFPKKSGLVLMKSAPDLLEVRTRTEFSWVYLVSMVGIVGAFVGMEILGRVDPPRGAIVFAIILTAAFALFMAFQCTYQWLRVANGTIEYQFRFFSIPLRCKSASLIDVRKLDTGEVDTESGGSVWAVIATPRWEVNFGLGIVTDSAAVEALLNEIRRLKRLE